MTAKNFSNPVEQRPVVHVRADWSGSTRRLIAGAMSVAVAGSLFMPNIALAAEWVDVGGTTYNAGTAAGDEAGTWAWDGADDMRLNGYDGGAIAAGGKLDVTYAGDNSVTSDRDTAIQVVDGNEEQAELTITGDGTLEATSGRSGIASEGALTIAGSGSVKARGEDYSGIEADGDLTITGGGTVEASSEYDNGIAADGDLKVSGSTVKATGSRDTAQGILVEGSAWIGDGASVTANGCRNGIWAYEGVTVDNAKLTARAAADECPFAIYADEGDIVFKNGALVDARAEGFDAKAIYTYNFDEGPDGGHIYITDSDVTAIATTPDADQGDGAQGVPSETFGILAETNGDAAAPATIVIKRSNVTAAGSFAAILASVTTTGEGTQGTIAISDSKIATPEGGRVCDFILTWEGSDGEIEYCRGQVIGTAEEVMEDLENGDVAKLAVITADEKPAEPAKPADKADQHKAQKAEKVAAKVAPTTAKIPATGDASLAGLAATGVAGIAALLGGLFASRKRS